MYICSILKCTCRQNKGVGRRRAGKEAGAEALLCSNLAVM